jgi:hypothetical protein
MTGEIIHLQIHRALKRADLYREQAVPRRAPAVRGSAEPVRFLHRPADTVSEGRNRQILERQVARIARLLQEVEELASGSDVFPAATLAQARDGVERARQVLQPLARAQRWADLADDGDPQPDIDDEELERMYRDLNPEA